jgi:tryptophan synthase alpha chain
MQPRDLVSEALRRKDRTAIVAFITAGYPSADKFLDVLARVASAADAVEIGVPFSDPMADGVTIQRSSQQAIAQGVTLRWILDRLGERKAPPATPVLLMSYLNPLLAFGYEELARRARAAGVAGFLVPDLPFEESAPLKAALDKEGLALVQFVTPATSDQRIATITGASQGFVYAVTRTGVTGGGQGLPTDLATYLDRVRRISPLPVCAGFGVREAKQVREIGAHADGAIVGAALVEALERGEDPAAFLNGLRKTP